MPYQAQLHGCCSEIWLIQTPALSCLRQFFSLSTNDFSEHSAYTRKPKKCAGDHDEEPTDDGQRNLPSRSLWAFRLKR